MGLLMMFDTRRKKLVTLASHYAVPTMYHFREFAAAGDLGRAHLHEMNFHSLWFRR